MTISALAGLPAPSAAIQAPVTPTMTAPVLEFDPMNPASVTPPPAVTPVLANPQESVAPVIPITGPATPVQSDNTAPDNQWLQDLINQTPAAPVAEPVVAPVQSPLAQHLATQLAPQPPAAPTVTPPTGLPDFPQPSVEFMPTTAPGELPNPAGVTSTEPAEDTSELGEIKKMLETLQGEHQKSESEAQFQQQVDEAIEGLKTKFGTADPKLIEEFNDIFTTFRAQLGQEFLADSVRGNLELKQQIQQLKSQIEDMAKATPAAPEPQVTDTNVYRNTIAAAIPNYQNLVDSAYFKQLLVTPVDPHNPEYTFNHKIGNMYRSQQTQDILSFFAEVNAKVAPANAQNTNVVVDSGTPAIAPVSQDSLTTDKLTDVLTRVMNGELKVSESEMLKLRQLHAKLAMKSN